MDSHRPFLAYPFGGPGGKVPVRLTNERTKELVEDRLAVDAGWMEGSFIVSVCWCVGDVRRILLVCVDSYVVTQCCFIDE